MITRSSLICLSLGGSVVVPQLVDVGYLKRLKRLLTELQSKGWRFLITVGGGATARTMQQAARQLGVTRERDLHLIGMAAARLNAELVRSMLFPLADDVLYPSLRPPRRLRKPVTLFVPDGRPGRTTDENAVNVAAAFRCTTLLNLSNVRQVFTADPKTHPGAKPLERIGWRAYLRMMPRTVTPGINLPFDPLAGRKAQRARLTVTVLDGRNLRNVRQAIMGRPFIGTIIHP